MRYDLITKLYDGVAGMACNEANPDASGQNR